MSSARCIQMSIENRISIDNVYRRVIKLNYWDAPSFPPIYYTKNERDRRTNNYLLVHRKCYLIKMTQRWSDYCQVHRYRFVFYSILEFARIFHRCPRSHSTFFLLQTANTLSFAPYISFSLLHLFLSRTQLTIYSLLAIFECIFSIPDTNCLLANTS